MFGTQRSDAGKSYLPQLTGIRQHISSRVTKFQRGIRRMGRRFTSLSGLSPSTHLAGSGKMVFLEMLI
jgi:hypothetical protein